MELTETHAVGADTAWRKSWVCLSKGVSMLMTVGEKKQIMGVAHIYQGIQSVEEIDLVSVLPPPAPEIE